MFAPLQPLSSPLELPDLGSQAHIAKFANPVELRVEDSLNRSLSEAELRELSLVVQDWQQAGRIRPGVRGDNNSRMYWLESGRGILFTQTKTEQDHYRITFASLDYTDFMHDNCAVTFTTEQGTNIPVKIGSKLAEQIGVFEHDEIMRRLGDFSRDSTTMHRGAGGRGFFYLNQLMVTFEITPDERVFALSGDGDIG